MEDFIKKTYNNFLKDYDKKTALKLLEISLQSLDQNKLMNDLEKEIIRLKTENKALKQDKIYSKKIDTYRILEKKEVYFSQEELELYLRTMYQNIEKKRFSLGITKLADKTKLDINKIKAIRTKLIDDEIIRVSGMKTEILKYLPDNNNENLSDMDINEILNNKPNKTKSLKELKEERIQLKKGDLFDDNKD